jgi:hypothetical protein
MNDRPLLLPPMRQKPRRIFLRIPIVARTPNGIVNRLLQVDQKKNGAMR